MHPLNYLLIILQLRNTPVLCFSLVYAKASSGKVTEYPELSSNLYQGDILLPSSMETGARNAVKLDKYKWPNGVVPYKFTSNYTIIEKNKVRYNMDLIETNTCVKFIPIEDSNNGFKNYIMINKKAGRGCSAVVGFRQDIKPVPVNFMPPECFRNDGTIQHELLHVLGLLHEQARPDRDDHIKVLWENINEGHKTDFGKAPPTHVTTYEVPYDLFSVMHYPNMAFSKNGKPTMVAKKNPSLIFGQRDNATNGDYEKIRHMYNCK